MRARVPEPMVMDAAGSVEAFDAVDPILQLPIYRLNAEALSALLPQSGVLLDLGSGTGRLLAHLAAARADVTIVGCDLADEMLEAGRAGLREAGLGGRVELRGADMTDPAAAAPEDVDAVSCVWALHHLPDEDAALRCLRGIADLRAATGCAVWIFDFARVPEAATFAGVLAMSPGAPAQLVADGRASEAAAWTPDELRGLLEEAGLGDLRGGAEQRLGHLQAWWAPGRAGGHASRWSAPPLGEPSASVLAGIRGGMPGLPSPDEP